MHNTTRQQLTLFADPTEANEIEQIREKFNPEQYRLIKSHVTLCREDEIEHIAVVLSHLQQLDASPITIQFGNAIRFDDGKGVLLPAVGDNEAYHLLRSKVLSGLFNGIRKPEPHITLMHPRNATCNDEIFATIQNTSLPASLSFHSISLIEQTNGGPWHTLQTYPLKRV